MTTARLPRRRGACDHLGARTAEREADHRDGILEEERDLRFPVIIIPDGVPERDAEALRFRGESLSVSLQGVPVDRDLLRDEDIHAERRRSQGTELRDLRVYRVGRLVAGREKGESQVDARALDAAGSACYTEG